MREKFLPIAREDLEKRGWKELDLILITGDAYVDHPAYGAAVIGRVLEAEGFRVGIIPQPDWKSTSDFMRLGRPRLFFGITSGNTDSMVANYTANKRPRKTDEYSAGNKTGLRPDRAVIVYANRLREVYGDIPIVLGGIEASLRRLAHYDFWDNRVRGSILVDSRADILVYGMGERQIVEIAKRLNKEKVLHSLDGIKGTVVVRKDIASLKNYVLIPSFEEALASKKAFNRAFTSAYAQMNPFTAKTIVQKHGVRFVVQFPPALPLCAEELDQIYELPYAYNWHPIYERQSGIRSLETVRFSLTAHRGCCGECSFCALYFHQGRIVQSRSSASLLKEAERLAGRSDFKGTINDVGGPTANMYMTTCFLWQKNGFCSAKKCLFPGKCKNLRLGYKESLELYRKLRQIPKVKHVFIESGFRHDLLIDESATEYLREVCRWHISGFIKAAPEHCSDYVLKLMNKPKFNIYEKFVQKFKNTSRMLKKNLFIVNYFISAYPGASLREALELALYLKKHKIHPEQIQDFIPAPLSLASCMYYTETDPFTGKKIYIPKTFRERKLQRALIQYNNPTNRKLIIEALRELKALHLAGKLLSHVPTKAEIFKKRAIV